MVRVLRRNSVKAKSKPDCCYDSLGVFRDYDVSIDDEALLISRAAGADGSRIDRRLAFHHFCPLLTKSANEHGERVGLLLCHF